MIKWRKRRPPSFRSSTAAAQAPRRGAESSTRCTNPSTTMRIACARAGFHRWMAAKRAPNPFRARDLPWSGWQISPPLSHPISALASLPSRSALRWWRCALGCWLRLVVHAPPCRILQRAKREISGVNDEMRKREQQERNETRLQPHAVKRCGREEIRFGGRCGHFSLVLPF